MHVTLLDCIVGSAIIGENGKVRAFGCRVYVLKSKSHLIGLFLFSSLPFNEFNAKIDREIKDQLTAPWTFALGGFAISTRIPDSQIRPSSLAFVARNSIPWTFQMSARHHQPKI